jgi:cytochrome P450
MLGNLPQFDPPHVHLQMARWAQEYGDFFRLTTPSKLPLLVCANTEAITQTLRDRPDGFRRTQRLEAIGKEMGLKIGLFGANGEVWQRQRRMVMSAFAPGHVKAYYPSLVKCADHLKTRWSHAVDGNLAIDLQADLMRFTVDAVAGLAFGSEVNTLASDDDIIQQHLNHIFPKIFTRNISALPYWRWFKLPSDRALDRAMAAVDTAIDGFIASARTRLAADPTRRTAPHNLLEAMIVAADEPGSGMDDDQVAGNVMTMLLAGEDTTANTLAWCIWLLFENPAALARAQREALSVLGDATSPSADQLNDLPYIDACLNETMRLKPVAPLLPLQALKDTQIADIAVPKGTVVINLMRHDSLNDRLIPQASAFKPERWLGEDGHNPSAAKRLSMPFGAGPRMCPGRYLALQEMKMVMMTLLTQFDIESVTTDHGGPPEERLMFTMTPVGLRMRLKARAGTAHSL